MGIIRGQLVLRFRDREALILFRRAATKDFEFGRAYYVKSPAVLEKSQVAFSTFASGMEHNNAASAALDTGFSRCISRVGCAVGQCDCRWFLLNWLRDGCLVVPRSVSGVSRNNFGGCWLAVGVDGIQSECFLVYPMVSLDFCVRHPKIDDGLKLCED